MGSSSILRPEGKNLQQWNKSFLLACVISVFLDPLFFYIPVIDGQDKNCLTLDRPLDITVSVLRSLIDSFYVIHIVFRFNTTRRIIPSSHERRAYLRDGRWIIRSNTFSHWLSKWIAIAKMNSSPYFVIDILSILPFPQVLLLLVIIESKNGPATLISRDMLKSVVLCQWIPRLIRIGPLFKEVKRISTMTTESAWAGAAVNLLFFMLASHVVGAFWYLLSIERNVSCWIDACNRDENCKLNYLYCGQHTGQHNALLNASCRQTTDFDFGIFLDSLQSGVVEMRDFPLKFFYCFWWGFRNLSSLGQNLNASTFLPEILFAISISVLGLALFALFIGNMQRYLQSVLSNSVREEEMRSKRQDAEQWMSHCMLPEDLKKRIRTNERYKWKTTRGVEEELFIQNLPKDIRRDIKRHLCLDLLKKVPIFGTLDEQLLDIMCDRLKRVGYTERSYLVREGDPVDVMLFFKRGKILSMSSCGGLTYSACYLKAGDFCGEELFSWALDPTSSPIIPISTRTLQSMSEVEAYALMADDLKLVASLFRQIHSKKVQHTFRYYSKQWRTWAAGYIQAKWRRRLRRELEKSLIEAESRLLNTFAVESGTTLSLGATIYASKFATHAIRSLQRNKAPSVTLLGKLPTLLLRPSEPDFGV